MRHDHPMKPATPDACCCGPDVSSAPAPSRRALLTASAGLAAGAAALPFLSDSARAQATGANADGLLARMRGQRRILLKGGVVARNCNARPDVADLAVLDQHICLREVADAAVEGEDDPALEQDATLALHPSQESIGIRSGGLRAGAVREELERGCAGRQSRARGQQRPAGRRPRGCGVRVAAAGIGCGRHRMVMRHRGFPCC